MSSNHLMTLVISFPRMLPTQERRDFLVSAWERVRACDVLRIVGDEPGLWLYVQWLGFQFQS